VYDMYPWDSASQGDYPPEPLRSRRAQKNAQKTREISPARAVQIALDRRDNGGDAAAPASHAAAPAPHAASPASHAAAPAPHAAAPAPHAAAPPAASAHATPPTASLTRQ
jgi:hypothetical protein